jgi:hypothetical protein
LNLAINVFAVGWLLKHIIKGAMKNRILLGRKFEEEEVFWQI